MSQNGKSAGLQLVVVGSSPANWGCLINFLKKVSEDKDQEQQKEYNITLVIEGIDVSLQSTRSLLNPELTDDEITAELDVYVKSCLPNPQAFLFIIHGGQYTTKEKRMVEILLSNFGEVVLQYLIVLSIEEESNIQEFTEELFELIDICNGRFCRFTEMERGNPDQVTTLLDMAEHMKGENWEGGYSVEMYEEARKKRTEDAAITMLRKKLREAEEKEREANKTLKKREDDRRKEMEEMKKRHAEERERDEAEKRQLEAKRESCAEAMKGYKDLLELSASSTAHKMAISGDVKSQISIVLLGLSGSGKTSAADTILERAMSRYPKNTSRSEAWPSTEHCEKREVCVNRKRLVVVDTPELWDEDGNEYLEHVKECMELAYPGPHAFILVMQVGRFTQGDSEILGHIQRTFGHEIIEHIIILFTRFDHSGKLGNLGDIDGYVANAHASLQDIIRRCGSRYYVLNNGNFHSGVSHSQVKELLSGVQKLAASHGGRPYRNRRFPGEE